MMRYILNRCKIAIREKKLWFLYTGIGVVIYTLYVIIFPSNYVLTAAVNFNIDDSDKLISVPGRSVWRQINRLVGAEQSFLATQVNNMPVDLQEKIMKKYIDEVQKNISRSNIANSPIRQRPQTMVLRVFSLSPDNFKMKYVFTYRGADYSMGVDLINYYSTRLVDYLLDAVYSKMEAGKVNEASGAGNAPKKIGKREGIPPVPERIQLSEDEMKIYKFLLERISTYKNSESRIISGRDYSISDFAFNFFMSVIISLVIVMIVIIFFEFTSKHLSSEVQAARYLNSHIIGTLREIKSIKGKK